MYLQWGTSPQARMIQKKKRRNQKPETGSISLWGAEEITARVIDKQKEYEEVLVGNDDERRKKGLGFLDSRIDLEAWVMSEGHARLV